MKPKKELVKSKKTSIDTMGGQAVVGGVMMRSNTHYAVAVRRPDGKIVKMSAALTSLTDKRPCLKKPLIRGVIYLVEMLVIGMKALAWSSNQSTGEDEEPLTKAEIAWTIILSLGLGIVLFLVIPFAITSIFVEKGIVFNLLDGLLRIAAFVLYLAAISFLKDIRTIFQYHGAEHKAVYCYEDEKALTVKNVQGYSTRHARCGSSFIIIVLLLSILVYSLVVTDSWTIRLSSRIILLPIIAGISYELLKWSSKHLDNPIVKLFVYPGLALQNITTKEPSNEQVEVAIASLNEALRVSKKKSKA